jgi:radical SAM protein with 4Fe4S-binding SPASM domain
MPSGFVRKNYPLFSKLNFRRGMNAAGVFSSYYFSRWTHKPRHWGKPVAVSIEPTTSCNLRCPECPSGLRSFTRPTGNLDAGFFQRTVDELSPHLLYLTFYFQGEPYLHPEFAPMIRYASEKKIFTATSTNAHFLDEKKAEATIRSGLNRLIVSIDGTTQEVYEQYRIGGSLEKVLHGTRLLLRRKRELKSKTPEVIFQFLVLKPNEHQLSEVKRLGKEIGVDEVRLKTAQVYDYVNGNKLIPSLEQFSRYKKVNSHYEIKNSLLNHCWKMWHSCVITWDGKVVPCCFDKDARHQLGDLTRQSFDEIWNGEAYRRFRHSLLQSRKTIDLCANCSEGTTVWA